MDCINTAGDFISIHALRKEGDVFSSVPEYEP